MIRATKQAIGRARTGAMRRRDKGSLGHPAAAAFRPAPASANDTTGRASGIGGSGGGSLGGPAKLSATKPIFEKVIRFVILAVGWAYLHAAAPPASRNVSQQQPSAAQSSPTRTIEDTSPKGALARSLEAACAQDSREFSRYLLTDSANSFNALPLEQQKTMLKRFSLTSVAGRPTALLDSEGQTVVRCDTPAETVTYRLSPPRINANVAFDSVAVEGSQTVDFGLVRQPDGWRLFSLGLLVINVPALVREWEQAELEANEHTAVADLVTLEQAIKTYRGAFGNLPDKLGQLGPAPPNQVSPDHAQLVPEELASGSTDGYRFRYQILTGEHGTADEFALGAVPIEYGKTGRKSFLLDAQGKLHVADKRGAPATDQDPVFTPRSSSEPQSNLL